MMGNNQNLFFSPEEKGRAFSDVLKEVQEYISSKYSTLMVEGGNDEVKQQVKRYISKYIADYRITVKGKTRESYSPRVSKRVTLWMEEPLPMKC